MRIDGLAAVIRPRTAWEGLDLGFAMGRRWFPTLFALWWCTSLPVGVLAWLWLGHSPSLWVVVVWWFKPVYEAPVLFWLSRRLFGESLGPRELWRSRAQLLPSRLTPSLLWRRLHPSRSFQMPLLMLEGLVGRARRKRQRVLQPPGGAAAWLTLICLHLESVLWISALLLVAFLIPQELPGLDLTAAFLDEASTPYWVSTLLYWLAMSVMAPFYVAAGFALYLTRRTELEAWDLELQFRRAAEPRREGGSRSLPRALPLLALALALTSALPQPVAAMDITREGARAEIEEVLDADDFGRTRAVQVWEYVGDEEGSNRVGELPDWLEGLMRALGRGGNLAAGLLKWLLYLMGAVLIAIVLQRVWQTRGARMSARRASAGITRPPKSLARDMGLPIPSDIPAAVQGHITRGDLRSALCLLYVASIKLLESRHGLAVPASATESECLALVQAHRPAEEGALMGRLIGVWRRLAYAHQDPAPGEVEVLLRDWRKWGERHGPAG